MGDYFKPLRRKIGVMTLVVACVFTGLWVRGFRIVDDVYFGEYLLTSGDGKIDFRTDKSRVNAQLQIISTSIEFHREIEESNRKMSEHNKALLAQSGDRNVDASFLTPDAPPQLAVVPYWSIVIPLTLLSAWLLLSRPKPAKQLDKPPPPI